MALRALERDDAVRAMLMWAERGDDLSSVDKEELSNAGLLVEHPQIQALPLAIRHIGTRLKKEHLSCRQYLEKINGREKKIRLEVKNLNEFLKYCNLLHLREKLSNCGIADMTDLMTTDLKELPSSCGINSMELTKLERMKERQLSDTQPTIAWELDIIDVTNRSSRSRNVLEVASLLDCQQIPSVVISQTAFPNYSDDTDRKGLLHVEISLLSSLSLIYENDDQFSMHSLVQQSVVKAMVRDGTLSPQLRALSKCLTNMLPQ